MSAIPKPAFLANPGSTGNNTHQSVGIAPMAEKICALLTIEAVGATPTITAKIQGSLDDPSLADGASNWFDLPFVTDTNDTVAASLVKTGVGAFPMWLSLASVARFVRKFRLVTSANTNVTYRGEGFQQYHS